MAKKIKIIGEGLPRIKITGPGLPRITQEEFGKLTGFEPVVKCETCGKTDFLCRCLKEKT